MMKPPSATASISSISLCAAALPPSLPTEQVWHGRAACGLIGLIATLVAFVALALTLLRVPFFSTIVRPAAPSISTVHGAKGVIGYIIPYIIFLLPAPLLYYWLIGYPYYMQPPVVQIPHQVHAQ